MRRRRGFSSATSSCWSDTDPSGKGLLRLLFGVQGFEVLLVGKDGAVKLRSRKPITLEALFAEIDAMPMRRWKVSN